MKRALLWFRNDLRLSDHEALSAAVASGAEIVPVYVFDHQRMTMGGARWSIGPHRLRFWVESVQALRGALRAQGSDLLIRTGDPAEWVPRLAEAFAVDAVYAHAEFCDEETRQERTVRVRLDEAGKRLKTFFGGTLIHPDDLPFSIAQAPDVFTRFRRAVEQAWTVRPATGQVGDFASAPIAEPGEPPTVDDVPADPRAIMTFTGGSVAGRQRLEAYVFEADALREYKETRNGLLEANDSTKLSPWLALGCISPREVYAAVERYERERVANDSTYWLVFELLWRDYWKFLALREGARLFKRSGIAGRNLRWSTDERLFNPWMEGKTGFPFVDAFMKELAATGFMSNRGRQNVASFLAKSLGVDWRLGAAWFEAHLVDYDGASNWGNWQYAAGVGTDPRDRVFNVVKQGRDYDPEGAYVRRWLPELPEGSMAHTPWRAGGPAPMVDPERAFRPPKMPKRGRRRR